MIATDFLQLVAMTFFGSIFQLPIMATESSGQQPVSKPIPNQFSLDFAGFTAPTSTQTFGSGRDKVNSVYNDSVKRVPVNSASPAISARNSGRRNPGMTAAERRDAKERQDEINAVRSL